MSRDKKVGEVVSAIISLVNNQHSCLVELLGHCQSTQIQENFFLTFYFSPVSKKVFVLMFFKPQIFTVILNLIYFSINFMLTASLQHESTDLIGKLICMT